MDRRFGLPATNGRVNSSLNLVLATRLPRPNGQLLDWLLVAQTKTRPLPPQPPRITFIIAASTEIIIIIIKLRNIFEIHFLRKVQTHLAFSILVAGVSILVLAYTALGSILFVTLEGELEDDMGTMETAVAASKPYPRTDLANADIRSR